MPISNLMIQRRRLNELKKLGFKEPRPFEDDSYTDFTFPVEIFTTQDTIKLANIQFYVVDLQTYTGSRFGERFAGMGVHVHKDPIEKRATQKPKLGVIQN